MPEPHERAGPAGQPLAAGQSPPDRREPGKLPVQHRRRSFENGVQFIRGRVAHLQLEKETIQLRLGQRIGAFHFQWVLRGEHEERLRAACASLRPP